MHIHADQITAADQTTQRQISDLAGWHPALPCDSGRRAQIQLFKPPVLARVGIGDDDVTRCRTGFNSVVRGNFSGPRHADTESRQEGHSSQELPATRTLGTRHSELRGCAFALHGAPSGESIAPGGHPPIECVPSRISGARPSGESPAVISARRNRRSQWFSSSCRCSNRGLQSPSRHPSPRVRDRRSRACRPATA